jgi:hypothetical protein
MTMQRINIMPAPADQTSAPVAEEASSLDV